LTDRIVLKGMEFFGFHGVMPEERRLGQMFTIDVTMQVDLAEAGGTDQLHQTVDYGEVYRDIAAVMAGPPFNLIEAVAETIAARILARWPRVERVVVRVEKPRAPLPGVFRYAAVEIERDRE